MAFLLTLLLLAPAGGEKTAEVEAHLKAGEKDQAIALLKEMAKLEGNDDEAFALVKLVRNPKVEKPPEVLEEVFLTLKGIKSRKVTKKLEALLDHSTLKKDPAIRIGVCRAFEGSADPAAADTLIDLMRDNDDRVVAAAAEAAGAYRYAKQSVRKDLFKTILDIYTSTWNLKNSVKQELKTEKRRAERKWEVVEKPMEKGLALLSNVTEQSPPDWRRWWNKNKNEDWADLEN